MRPPRLLPRAHPPLWAAPLAIALTLSAGCAGTTARLRLVSSDTARATWSLVLSDGARDAELLLDGRPLRKGCTRAGQTIRCELRGLFPGGHVVELRLPGAVLRRSIVIGRPWAARPLVVKVRTPDEARAAAQEGADAVLVQGDPAELEELSEAAHLAGARVIAAGPDAALALERAGVDALLDAPIPPELARRFPEARALALDRGASARAAAVVDAAPGEALAALGAATGLVEAKGSLLAVLALAAPYGALVDDRAFPLLRARRRHAAARDGTPEAITVEPGRARFLLRAGHDEALVVVNATDAPWRLRPERPRPPLDLLGGAVEGDELTVRPRDAALVVAHPSAAAGRY